MVEAKRSGGGRLTALDALRGLAVAGMILVVSPGSWDYRLWPLDHAAWNGYRPADIVFPLFLFAVGASLALGFPPKRPPAAEFARIARRTLALIALGLFLNALPSFDLAHLRIPGILQRIALCYAIAASVLTLSARGGAFPWRTTALAALALLVVYGALMLTTSAPGFPVGSTEQGGTLASFIDRQVFSVAHLWPYGTDPAGKVVYDPEGLLATLPATANVLFGALAMHFLGRAPTNKALLFGLAAGVATIALGHALNPVLVINKRIWTPSFALVSGGWSLLVFAGLLFLARARAFATAAWPLLVVGGNAIVAFSLSQALGAFAAGAEIGDSSLQGSGFALGLKLVGDPYAASLLCALAVLALIVALIAPLHLRGVHLRL